MKVIITILITLLSIKVIGQNNNFLKTDSSFYYHSVDSLIKYIKTKEKPVIINLLAEKSILKFFPNEIQGVGINKIRKLNRRKSEDNYFYIYIGKLGGTATNDSRSVFLVVSKCINYNWASWEGYGGYNFQYSLDNSLNSFLLKDVSKSIIIR